jgi:tryptophanyl-tRNA synthetase
MQPETNHMARRALTGIKPTGEPHLGNWLGAIEPALALARDYETYYFIADYHALTTVHAGDELRKHVRDITAAYLAFGLDPGRSVFYRQSDVPEIFELSWILACFTPKGFMNRAHAYKDFVARNLKVEKDEDADINMGLFGYPVLMAADILMFNADVVPVGADQKQHVEFARDIAQRFNTNYGAEIFHLPEPRISDSVKTVVGLDGRKMSKSYGNTIPLYLDEKPLLKRINQIITNSQTPEEPKNPDESPVFALHQLLLDAAGEQALRAQYRAGGMGWGQAKKLFHEALNERLKAPRAEYNRLIADPGHLDAVLAEGKDRARAVAAPFLEKVRGIVGVR